MKKLTILIIILIFASFTFAQSVLVKDGEAEPNTLLEINDEGITGSITLPSGGTPEPTTYKLYNEGGTLHWHGSALGSCDCEITRTEFELLIARVNVLEGCVPETEICDGIDNDCNGQVDEGFDSDGDGYTTCEGDCDDGNPTVYPGALEIVGNSIDNDCDGTELCYKDADDDGYRSDDLATVISTDSYCDDSGEAEFSDPGGDCDDTNPTIYPGATEICDGKDNNCVGGIPADELDDDGDGMSECQGDCDDTDVEKYPGNTEVCDGKDNDCVGGIPADEIDDDGDGISECEGDCDDTDVEKYPGNTEVCDGKDNDCIGGPNFPGEIDNDGDGISECEGDCDDDDVTVYPGATEVCGDGVDNNCVGGVDEGCD